MPIFKDNDVCTELDGVRPLGAFEPQLARYPYLQLSSEYFELLTYELFSRSTPPSQHRSWDKAMLMSSGSDAARDVALYSREKLMGVVQCKRHKNNIALSTVLKEISKCILYPEVDDGLPKLLGEMLYFLALAGQPSKRVIEFFGRPAAVTESNLLSLQEAVREVCETYVQLENIEEGFAVEQVMRFIKSAKFVLLRSEDIDAWLQYEQQIASRFFAHRHVIDSDKVEAQNAEMIRALGEVNAHLSSVPLITDVDLKFIRDRIESVQESHRVSLGFASLFGFPREMFAGKSNLEKLIAPLVAALNGLSMGYIDWTQEAAKQHTARICSLPEVLFSVHPFAKQMVLSYLSLTAADIALKNLAGDAMSKIIERSSKRKVFAECSARLDYVCEELLEQGGRYLNSDFSEVVGDEELLDLKLTIIHQLISGIEDEGHLRTIIKQGKEVLLPHLETATSELEESFSYQPSIFIMGSSGLDSKEMLKQMMETAKAWEEMNDGSGKGQRE